MKKVHLFLGAIMLATVTLFISCTDNTTVDTPPTISFVTGAGYVSADQTLTVNTPFTVKILAQANATSSSKIQALKITRIYNNQTIFDTTLSYNDATVTLEVGFVALSEAGVENIEFKATDKDGQSAMIHLQITTEPISGGEIDSFEMKVLGSYQSATGSSFASINGNVYTLQEAFNNQTLIDFMYWWGGSTNATIGSPNDPNANAVFTNPTYGLSKWTTAKNDTKFKTTTLTSAAFDAVTDASTCIDIATGADQTRVGELAVDQVIAFITVTDKHGLIRVKNINPSASGDITIDVKVEK